jgi:hypothetical protein
VNSLLGSFTPLKATSLADIAVWADDFGHSVAGTWSSSYHFFNVDKSNPVFSYKYCAQYCVVKAIQNYTQILSQRKLPNDQLALALAFLVHFAGDVHQPLHVSYIDDLGGNKITVDFFGASKPLHTVWDTSMIEKYINGQSNWLNLVTEINDMIKQNPDIGRGHSGNEPVTTWAEESLSYTNAVVYTYPGLSKAPPGITQLQYYTQNIVLVKQRIMIASVRLGNLLNSIFGSVTRGY